MHTMKTSERGKNLIKRYEGLHDGDLKAIGLQPKMCPAGIWTEGWGHAMIGKDGKFLKGIGDKEKAYKMQSIHNTHQADELLSNDLKQYELIVTRKVKVPLNQNQFDALVSHTYNTGGSDTLFRLINEKSNDKVIYAWFTENYIRGGGVILKGLIRRRKEEADLFFSNADEKPSTPIIFKDEITMEVESKPPTFIEFVLAMIRALFKK
jgi:lysozyme